MTCIVGVKHQGHVYIGGDSASMSGDMISQRNDPKVFIVGNFVIGVTSSFRVCQLLRYSWIPPEHPIESTDDFKYMCTSVIESIRTVFKEGGVNKREHEVDNGGQFLIGYGGRLYYIDLDYQVQESLDDYDVCGYGREVAIGALFALKNIDLPPKYRIQQILEAAYQYNAAVRPPWVILSI